MKSASTLAFVLLAACGSEQSSSSSSLTRAPYECSDVEVHVIGIDEATDGEGGTSGGATILLQRPGRHIVVVNAFDETNWNIEVSNGAELEAVYATGHQRQHVKTNVGARIISETFMDGGPDLNAYQWPSKNADALLKLASIRLDLHATSFHGCQGASKWVIGENLATTSNCAAGSYTQFDAVIDCDGDNACGEDDGGGDGGGGGDGDGGGGGGGGGSGGGGSGSDGDLY